jgi:hypothetical protein
MFLLFPGNKIYKKIASFGDFEILITDAGFEFNPQITTYAATLQQANRLVNLFKLL